MAVRTFLAFGILVLALLALAPACENTDVTAPANSTIILQAIPASVLIDQDAGQTAGATQIYALILDAGGLPLEDIPVVFTSTGGRLDSENFCDAEGTCTRSGGACAADDDCPPPVAPAIKTNPDGLALDRLTLRLIEDLDTVDVTAQISVGSQKITVAKNVNLGPTDAEAKIVAVPAAGQRTGLPFAFDGTGTTFDPQVELTCFEWTVDSSIDANDKTYRGPDLSIISLTLGTVGDPTQDQDLTVRLRVSDVPGVDCDDSAGPDPADLSPLSAVIDYAIRCDVSDPIVNAGSNVFASLSANNFVVSVDLKAIAGDPEDPVLDYQWSCGTGGVLIEDNGQTVTCEYYTEGTNTATVTVVNDCGRTADDSVIVQINP